MSDPIARPSLAGVFTRSDALKLGHSDQELQRWVRQRTVRRLRRGVFGSGQEPEYADQRLVERGRGLAMHHGGNIAISHHAALAFHGIALHAVPLGVLHAVRLGGAPRSGSQLVIARPRRPPPTVEVNGVLVVKPEVAIVQVACAFGFVAGLVAADSALHRDKATAQSLCEEIERTGAMPGIAAAREMSKRCREGAESPGETLLRLAIEQAGFDVELQCPVGESGREPFAFADMRIAGTRSLWEFDGAVKYEGAEGKQALVAEKVREDRIRDLGWGLQRVIWRNLGAPDRLQKRIRVEAERLRIPSKLCP
ncbi:MAG: hypothetical protein WBG36_15345 [Ornithinimicrobium sp.]